MENLWEQWSAVHDEADQKKRQASAAKTPCTPISINAEERTGTFQGSSGTHSTTLEICSCIDFNRRKKPCKHMYRLAMELHLFDGNFQSNSKDIAKVRPKGGLKIAEAVEVIETLSKKEQHLLWNILYKMKFQYHSEYAPVNVKLYGEELTPLIDRGILKKENDFNVMLEEQGRNQLNEQIISLNLDLPFKKNMKKSDLILWIKENIPEHIEKICADFVTVIVTEKFLKSKHKMYLYLNRLFRDEQESDFSAELGFAPEDDSLPDDEVTSLLKQYHHIK